MTALVGTAMTGGYGGADILKGCTIAVEARRNCRHCRAEWCRQVDSDEGDVWDARFARRNGVVEWR